MASPDENLPARPALAFRVGISGARKLRADQIQRIAGQLRDVFTLLKQEIDRLSCDSFVCRSYQCAPGAKPVPRLRILSPLARGADRMAARAALDLGYELYVPMPFSQEEYERDFTGRGEGHDEEAPQTAEQDLNEFRELLGRATTQLALDGGRAPEAASGQAYEAVGRYVVRHNDLLIAIWDGGPGGGRGGTADIVHFAAAAGVPVWWIDASAKAGEPVWLTDIQDLRDGERPVGHPREMLRDYLENLILVPRWVRPLRHDSIGRLARMFHEGKLPPADAFFAEPARPRRAIWNVYADVMKWTCRGLKLPQRVRRSAPADAAQRYWYDLQGPVAARAGEYADRYRSTYVLVILLATLALVFGAATVWLERDYWHNAHWVEAARPVAAVLEMFALFGPVALIAASVAREWHERSIDYRIVAELFRKQQTLAAAAWALPFGSVEHLEDMEGLSWVCWLFAAMQRAAPLPQGDMAGEKQHEVVRAAVQALIDEQLEYHGDRERKSLRASETFERYGRLTFFGILASVGVKWALEWKFPDHHHMVILFGLMATVLPGVSAAFVGLRSYAEWQMLAEQSHHMLGLLKQARERVDRLKLTRPSVLQDLGAEALAVANIMLQDLEGWGRLFRGKSMDA
jgi:hypothetical protein